MKKTTIAIIGVGYVGSTIAYTLGLAPLAAEILLVDCNTQKCLGELYDLEDAFQHNYQKIKKATCKDASQADIIIICAGKNQQPGEPRQNLYRDNRSIVHSILTELLPINPQAILIMVTNPVDLLALDVYKKNILPPAQILGSGTWLDMQRLRRFLETDYGIPHTMALPYVLGEHGDSSYVVWPHSYPYTTLTDAQKNALAQKVKNEVYAIIEAKGATAYGVAQCVYEYCASIIHNQQRIFAASAYDAREQLFYSQVVALGNTGITHVINLPHSPQEELQKRASLDALKKYST